MVRLENQVNLDQKVLLVQLENQDQLVQLVQWALLENLVMLDPKETKANLVNPENLDQSVQKEWKDRPVNRVTRDLLVMMGLPVYLAIR